MVCQRFSLVPREGKESLVTTACACANPSVNFTVNLSVSRLSNAHNKRKCDTEEVSWAIKRRAGYTRAPMRILRTHILQDPNSTRAILVFCGSYTPCTGIGNFACHPIYAIVKERLIRVALSLAAWSDLAWFVASQSLCRLNETRTDGSIKF